MRGAGGSEGGFWRFIIGLVMLIAGGYLFLDSVKVTGGMGHGMGHGLYNIGGVSLTSGMVLIPAIFGIGIIFYNAKNPLGWVLTIGSLIALVFGVIRSMHFRFAAMSVFDLVVILVLFIGGIGLFLSSLKEMTQKT